LEIKTSFSLIEFGEALQKAVNVFGELHAVIVPALTNPTEKQ
jgi:hypothetical protein